MVIVTGATGFIGKRLVDFLRKAGEPFYVLTRNLNNAYVTDRQIRTIVADISEDIQLPSDVTTVFHCAGVISKSEEMSKVNVTGTLHIAQAALERNCRLVHLSSAGVVGRTPATEVNEAMKGSPEDAYEKTKMEAEIIISKYVEKGLKAQILRPTIVFGSGKTPEQDSFLHLVRAIKNGRYFDIDKGSGIYNIIHVDEVVRALFALDTSNLPNGEVFFINTPISFGEFADIVRDATGNMGKPVTNVPYWIALCITAVMAPIPHLTGKKMPLTFPRLRALTNRTVFSQDKIINMTGYSPAAVQDSIKKVCDEYAQRGLLG